MPELVDLRSDTVTRPTEGMRRAMYEAEVGDDVYGEDPSVCALEEAAAELLGHEHAVYVPSGTMGNLLALRASVGPGQEVLAEADAHIVTYELGGLAAIAGAQTRTVPGERGILPVDGVAGALRAWPDGQDYRMVRTAVLAVENTSVRGGGSVYPLQTLTSLRALTAQRGVTHHCDGARIWNAAVASGTSLAELGRCFDTLSVCLSKGLGAPVGSLVICDRARGEVVREWRKRLGGGMRQAGVIAAAGLYALRHHRDRLADDHRRAQQLAVALASADSGSVDPRHVQTNIVLVRVADAPAFVARAAQQGVLVGAVSPDTVRALFHLDVDDAATDRAVGVLARLVGEGRPG